ncbi:Flp family type IVb pilin [Nitratireductor sp. GISD-1A_MAKvit]|uniref:Flp family type IVb pilin n=1 Tax=Nitratireductor sp. GISD-1A_MAKvit TaxID=3234198 RepID=UPI0034659AD8
MANLFSRFLKDESGATAIEYGLLAALIALAIIGGATALGTKINDTFTGVAGKLPGNTN